MTVHHEEEQMISDPLPSSLRCLQEGFDLSRIEEVLGAMRISRTLNNIRGGNVEHGRGFLRSLVDCGAQLSTKLRYRGEWLAGQDCLCLGD